MAKIDGYKFGNKNNWRRWMWNRVCEKLGKIGKHKKDAVVVYLAGKEDLDRPIAIQHGFSSNNLIAVDRNKNVIKTLKKKGALCIQSDLSNVLEQFKYVNTKIDVLIADYCCGLVDSISDYISGFFMKDGYANAFSESAVVASNFMRGRDNGEILDESEIEENRHRGYLFAKSIARRTIAKLYEISKSIHLGNYSFGDIVDKNLKDEYRTFLGSNNKEHIILEQEKGQYESLEPEYRSYKSGNIYMDSVVYIESCGGGTIKDVEKKANKLKSLLAVRTMRKNGKLKPCPTE